MVLGALISYWQAIVLGLLQGVSELFPVSSLGHSVILPRLLGWNIHRARPARVLLARLGADREGPRPQPS
jgi:undecaprenyl pyrophosphate phosphatase UppP